MDHSQQVSAIDALSTTRAIRRYTEELIPNEDLNRILWLASRAPSGSNRQPFRFLAITRGENADKVKSLLGDSFRKGWATKLKSDGYQTGSGQDPNSAKSRQAAAMQHYVDHIEEVPVIVFGCLVRYRDASPTEGASIYPACQNLLIAARSLGFGGALTMWHQGVENQLRELLGIPDNVAISACITLGKPQGSHGPVRRRPISELVFENQWGSSPSWAIDPDGTRFTSAGPK
ncbi:MAG: nitroreductase family protein [Actinomycetes bacterium]